MLRIIRQYSTGNKDFFAIFMVPREKGLELELRFLIRRNKTVVKSGSFSIGSASFIVEENPEGKIIIEHKIPVD